MAAIRLKEDELNGLIMECVKKALREIVLGPGQRMDPYAEHEREENFAPYNGKCGSDMYKRNPSYKAAAEAARRRMEDKRRMRS